jgi:Zn-dependent protease with chaperone function
LKPFPHRSRWREQESERAVTNLRVMEKLGTDRGVMVGEDPKSMKRIVEKLFIFTVVAGNIYYWLRHVLPDPTVRAPLWADLLFLVGVILISYWWARFLIWLAKLLVRGLKRLWQRRSDAG